MSPISEAVSKQPLGCRTALMPILSALSLVTTYIVVNNLSGIGCFASASSATRMPQRRIVFITRVIEGMSVEETADLLGLQPKTVKTRLHRARRLVREQLDKQIGPILMDAFPFAGRRCERMFLSNHADGIAGVYLFVLPTVAFQTLIALSSFVTDGDIGCPFRKSYPDVLVM